MYINNLILLVIMLFAVSCGNAQSDLFPSGEDKRPLVQAGTIGPNVGQLAPDFTAPDSFGNQVTLSTIVSSTSVSGTVLYFTMWCPQCLDEMTEIRNMTMPSFSHVSFLVVDYVSGSVVAARNAQFGYGFGNSGFVVIADTTHNVSTQYGGTMGTTVVIDHTGIVRMNESYKTSRLQSVLSSLP